MQTATMEQMIDLKRHAVGGTCKTKVTAIECSHCTKSIQASKLTQSQIDSLAI